MKKRTTLYPQLTRHFRMPWAFSLATACLLSPPLGATDIQVARYSLQDTVPAIEQRNLLAAIVTIDIPARLITVGEAMDYLLQRSGYRLPVAETLPSATRNLLALPLPAAHRHLGSLTLEQALQTLAGPAFHPIQDPVHRLVSFELCTATTTADTPQVANAEAEGMHHDD